MTLRNRALLLVGILGIISTATAGCELIADFDRSKIDGGSSEVADAETPDGSTSDVTQPVNDAGQDSTLPDSGPDAADASQDVANDTNIAETGGDSGDAGCSASSGCPIGEACDLATHGCTTTCSSSQPCNARCCNGTTCETTETPSLCGVGGAMCASCIVGDAGAACVSGSTGGTCGCEGPTDCPETEACDTSTHQCTKSCSVSQLCNGGCCSGGTCVGGTDPGNCGSSGTACLQCPTDSVGASCLAVAGGGTCGCTGASDCTLSDGGSSGACDLGTHTCTVACSLSQACSGSCCNGGTCGGGITTACGPAGGTCSDCTNDANGHQCISTACGCNDPTDCPVGNSCDQGTHKCVTACSNVQACNGVCCNGSSCAASDTNQGSCGNPGAMCATCGGSSGAACISTGDAGTGGAGGSCGCNVPGDCPTGMACEVATHTCTSACSGSQACNGTCCSSTTNTCAASDTQASTCGSVGGACAICAPGNGGAACITSGVNGACGCNSETDCPVNMACDTASHTCTTTCSLSQLCNTGCCNAGQCAQGTLPGSCGSSGSTCGICTGSSLGTACEPVTGGGTCGCASSNDCLNDEACGVTGTCSTACGPGVLCHNSCCNSSNVCVNDTQAASCGASESTCTDCTSNTTAGDKCVASVCGCNVAGDCPAGDACDTTSHTCTTACSSTQACNGGCCSAASSGTCVLAANTGTTQCGSLGAVCVDCTATCSGSGCSPVCTGTPSGCVDTSIGVFSATPSTINVTTTTNLAWTTNGATSCSIDHGVGAVNCSGNMDVTPTGDTTYTLTASGTGGTATAQVTVTMNRAATCNGYSAASAPLITETDSTGATPPWGGGTLVDGTYVLTSDILYGQADNNPTSTTNRIVWELTNSSSGTATLVGDQLKNAVDSSAGGTLAPIAATTTLTLNLTCGSTGTATVNYSVTGTTPVTLAVDNGGGEVWTFQKQ